MALPIADENPTKLGHKSPITIALILINVLVFFGYQIDYSTFFQDIMGAGVSVDSILGFGLIPSVLFGTEFLEPTFYIIPAPLTLVSYDFLHASVMHLVGNMLILWVFGDNIEQALGRYQYLAFYMLGGIASGLVHALMMSDSIAPMIGASGAVSAVGAAYLLLHPRAKLWILLFFIIPVKIPAWIAIGAWLVLQVYSLTDPTGGQVAWWAHIGGFGFGVIYILLLRRDLIHRLFKDYFLKNDRLT